ncbi:MAG TPA: response regulator [Blastocatellia bacterium]|nr:response regulator [Blastocatellia bacterium]
MPEPLDSEQAFSILIVDDEEYVRQLLVSCLGSTYICCAADNAEQAIERLESNEFDLVVTDITMPGISGLELCKILGESHPSTPVLIISGLRGESYRDQAIRLGARGFIEKPFDLGLLMNLVDQTLRPTST